MSRLQRALSPRDAFNGSCESAAGCDCIRTGQLTCADIDRAIADRRQTITDAIERAEAEREIYRRGWRWGVLDGAVLGGLVVAIAFTLGRNWSWTW